MSAFIQLKHDFKNNFILNTGARYDFRDRYTNKKIKQFSPRVAIIWTPTKHMNYKLSYARSFVDAPYFYRASKVVYDGNENLDAQFMDNYQLSAIYSFPKLHLKYETCVFYNYVMDVITLINTGYMNSGTIKNIGWENVIEYQRPGFKAIATTYLQHAINGHKTTYDASESIDYINSIPNFTAHLQLQKSLTKKLWFVAKGSFNSKQTMYYTSEMVLKYNSTDYLCGTEYHIPSCFLLDLGTKYSNGNWDFSLNCQNVFNHKYRLGGDRVPVLQQGRIILGTVSVCIK
jgi:iron complex outermembrane receptor protein